MMAGVGSDALGMTTPVKSATVAVVAGVAEVEVEMEVEVGVLVKVVVRSASSERAKATVASTTEVRATT